MKIRTPEAYKYRFSYFGNNIATILRHLASDIIT